MAGKGDKWRKKVNYKRYYDNFDKIFRKETLDNNSENSLIKEDANKPQTEKQRLDSAG